MDLHSASTSTRTIQARIRYRSNWWTKTRTTRCSLSWATRSTMPTQLRLTSRSNWTWSNSRCTTRRITWMGSIHRIERTLPQTDKLWRSNLLRINWAIKIIKSVRTRPTTKLTNRDESYYLNMGLRRRFKVRLRLPSPPPASQARPSKMAFHTAVKLQPRTALSRKVQAINHPSSSRGMGLHS